MSNRETIDAKGGSIDQVDCLGIAEIEHNILVGGIVSLTTNDYPSHIAAVIFTQGCPWKCVYCHNPHLQVLNKEDCLPWDDIMGLLETRKNLLEAVVFSGGEPLAQKNLPYAIKEIKQLGFKVGLHTGGAFPGMMKNVLPMIDWVGFDVKTEFDKYENITQMPCSGAAARQSLDLLLSSGVEYEVRITLDKSLSISTISKILKLLSQIGVNKAVLQNCRDAQRNVIKHPIVDEHDVLQSFELLFTSFSIR